MDLNGKKKEIDNMIKKKEKIRAFTQTYKALTNTLANIYPEMTELVKWSQNIQKNNESGFFEKLSEKWFSETEPFKELIEHQDPDLFAKDLPCLKKLHIQTLWKSNSFTANSQKYLWMYIQQLNQSAAYINQPPENNGNDVTHVQRDIEPPDVLNDVPLGLADFYKHLPKNMFSNVSKVAESYNERVKNGEMKLEDINFGEVSKEMFSSVKMEDFKSIAQNAANIMKSFTDNNSDFAKTFTELTKH